ncbi:hypothetical protein CYY_003749 [Polysphondylium violaceum]|uniref:Aldehyde dehydrogenase domain-containing protein n=1 Tax=Polysphondylium violaceum TaxID=133409 RepID=A0A8J4PZ94_9MYCE|nr:hypothetical protein CYY_003749 [Polysphondylium violaceum]
MLKLKIKEYDVEIHTSSFIKNEWWDHVDPNEMIDLINPATEELIGTYRAATREEVDLAVVAAKKALNKDSNWMTMSLLERGRLLNKLADRIESESEVMALIESLNMGKPIFESENFDMKQVVSTLRYFAGWTDKIGGKTIPLSSVSQSVAQSDNSTILTYTKQVPIGVVALILPWNFPLQLLMWKLAPCLAAGNTVVIKPSEITPLTTFYLAQLVKEVGFPPGVVNVVSGFGPIVGDALSSHMEIDKISFTGSTKVGKMVQVAATNSNLKQVSLELGGKSPIIVFDDCTNLDQVVLDSMHALFWNAGQCCSAGSRIYVQSSIYDLFVQKMEALVKNRVLGDPLEVTTQQGPQVSKTQLDSVLNYIDIGIKQKARLVCGGKRSDRKGYYIEPTVFADVKDSMTIAKEEIFGPVMCLIKFDTVDEAIEKANTSDYGLVGAVYTRDVNKAIIVSDRVKSGLVWVNTYNLIEASLPWGGFKSSGGGRDLSQYALMEYTETKTVVISAKF